MRWAEYRKRPIAIRATLWNPPADLEGTLKDLYTLRHMGVRVEYSGVDRVEMTVEIWNSEEQQWIRCPRGHWIIEGIKGEHYPCSNDVFLATYEAA